MLHRTRENIPVTSLKVTLALLTVLHTLVLVNRCNRHRLRHAIQISRVYLTNSADVVSTFYCRRSGVFTTLTCAQSANNIHVHFFKCFAIFEHLGEINAFADIRVTRNLCGFVVHRANRCSLVWLRKILIFLLLIDEHDRSVARAIMAITR